MAATYNNYWLLCRDDEHAARIDGQPETWVRMVDVERVDLLPTAGGNSWQVRISVKGETYKVGESLLKHESAQQVRLNLLMAIEVASGRMQPLKTPG